MVSLTSLAARSTPGSSAHSAPPAKPSRVISGSSSQAGRSGKARAPAGREPGAHVKLAFAADIDQAEAGRQRDRDGGQQQRGHAHEQLGKAVGVAEDVDQRVGIGLQRVLAGGQQQSGEDRQRGNRDDHGARDAKPRIPAARAASAATAAKPAGGAMHAASRGANHASDHRFGSKASGRKVAGGPRRRTARAGGRSPRRARPGPRRSAAPRRRRPGPAQQGPHRCGAAHVQAAGGVERDDEPGRGPSRGR